MNVSVAAILLPVHVTPRTEGTQRKKDLIKSIVNLLADREAEEGHTMPPTSVKFRLLTIPTSESFYARYEALVHGVHLHGQRCWAKKLMTDEDDRPRKSSEHGHTIALVLSSGPETALAEGILTTRERPVTHHSCVLVLRCQ